MYIVKRATQIHLTGSSAGRQQTCLWWRMQDFSSHSVLLNPAFYNKLQTHVHLFTVFLSRFGAFLRSEIKFSKLLVQPLHHIVTCARHNRSFSFFWTSCDCFVTFMQSIMYICLRFPTLSVANIMLLKMYYIVLCAIVFPLKTSSH